MNVVERILGRLGYLKSNRALTVDLTAVDKTMGMSADPYGLNYVKTYGANVLVYKSIKLIADTGAGIPLRFYNVKDDEEVTGGDFFKLWQSINPFVGSYEFRMCLLGYLALMGEVFVAHEDNLREMFILRPDRIKVMPDEKKKIAGYLYQSGTGARPIRYKAEEITQFKQFNPDSDFRGLSAIKAGMLPLTVDFWAANYNKDFFKNSALPSGVLSVDGDVDADFVKLTREEWEKTYGARYNKTHRLAILGRGTTFQDITKTAKDMEFTKLREMSREEILSLWGVPPVLVGVFRYANYANSQQQVKIFWEFTMKPILRLVESIFNDVLIPKIEEGIYCEHDLSDVDALKENELLKAQTAQVLSQSIFTINEARERVYSYPPIEGGDELPKPIGNAGVVNTPKAQDDVEIKTMTPEEIQTWGVHDKRLNEHEAGVEQDMVEFFNGQEKRVLKEFDNLFKSAFFRDEKFTEEQIDLIMFMGDEIERLKNASSSVLKRILRASASQTLIDLNIDIAFDLSPAIEKWIKDKSLKLSGLVNETTKRKIKRVLIEGIESGKPVEVMRKGIQEVFKDATKSRARMIARTETNSTMNKGIVEGWRKSEVVDKKVWLTAPGAEFPRHHLIEGLNKQTVGLDEYFNVSGELLEHPGDPSGSAKNIINCRCTMIAKVKE